MDATGPCVGTFLQKKKHSNQFKSGYKHKHINDIKASNRFPNTRQVDLLNSIKHLHNVVLDIQLVWYHQYTHVRLHSEYYILLF